MSESKLRTGLIDIRIKVEKLGFSNIWSFNLFHFLFQLLMIKIWNKKRNFHFFVWSARPPEVVRVFLAPSAHAFDPYTDCLSVSSFCTFVAFFGCSRAVLSSPTVKSQTYPHTLFLPLLFRSSSQPVQSTSHPTTHPFHTYKEGRRDGNWFLPAVLTLSSYSSSCLLCHPFLLFCAPSPTNIRLAINSILIRYPLIHQLIGLSTKLSPRQLSGDLWKLFCKHTFRLNILPRTAQIDWFRSQHTIARKKFVPLVFSWSVYRCVYMSCPDSFVDPSTVTGKSVFSSHLVSLSLSLSSSLLCDLPNTISFRVCMRKKKQFHQTQSRHASPSKPPPHTNFTPV